MKTFYEFRSEADPDLHGFTDEVSGSKLPSENGPWTFIRQLASEGEWPSGISKAVTAAGVFENGFSLSNFRAAKPIIESDRVEGTAVYDPSGSRIGTIRRLMIEKVSGKVLYADITFGGFLGLGNITTPSPGRSSVTTKGSADIAPTSQPSRSGVLRPSTAMRWCGPIANAKIKPVIIGVYRRVSGISLRPELHLIGCPVRTGRASARARVSCHSSVASVPIVMEFSNASLLPGAAGCRNQGSGVGSSVL